MRCNFPKEKHALFHTYAPLIFTLFYFVDPIVNPVELALYLPLFAIYFAQVWLYHLMATTQHQGLAFGYILLSLLLSIAGSSFNLSAYAFQWFNAYFGALKFTPRKAIGVFLIVCSSAICSALIYDYNHPWYYLPVLIPTLGLFCYGLYDRLDNAHRAAEAKSREEIEQLAYVAERERIARDLHDLMGHSLTTIALKAQLAEKLGKSGQIDKALVEISELALISSETLSQMRSVISGYKAKSLESLIEHHCDTLEKWHFRVENQLSLPELSAKEESNLALVLTEAITNIIRHSKGNQAFLSSEAKPSKHPSARWAFHIRDNGNVGEFKAGNGLKGMHERLDEIGARLEISKDPGMHLAIYLNNHSP